VKSHILALIEFDTVHFNFVLKILRQGRPDKCQNVVRSSHAKNLKHRSSRDIS
jgi:hypothetical protein